MLPWSHQLGSPRLLSFRLSCPVPVVKCSQNHRVQRLENQFFKFLHSGFLEHRLWSLQNGYLGFPSFSGAQYRTVLITNKIKSTYTCYKSSLATDYFIVGERERSGEILGTIGRDWSVSKSNWLEVFSCKVYFVRFSKMTGDLPRLLKLNRSFFKFNRPIWSSDRISPSKQPSKVIQFSRLGG